MNFWVGCDKIAPECQYCYIYREIRKQADWEAKRDQPTVTGTRNDRNAVILRKPWGEVYLTKTWADPYDWQREVCGGKAPGQVGYSGTYYKRVFTNSLSDFFIAKADGRSVCKPGDESAPSLALMQHRRPAAKCGSTLWRDCAWQVIRDTPNCVYLILTKRPELILSRLPKDWGEGYSNVWIGTSVGCRATLSKLDSLRKVPVHPDAVRFVSCEPLLEDISQQIDLTGIGWLIAGGESGDKPMTVYDPNADWKTPLKVLDARGHRHMDIRWARNLRRLCYRNEIPFWFKQVSGTKSGQGEDALGGIVQAVPPAPNGGKWIDDPEPPKPGKTPWFADNPFAKAAYLAKAIAVKGRILEVDDYGTREIYALICERRGFEVIRARCGDEAIELYRRYLPFALVLTDYYFYDYLPEPPLSETDCLRNGALLALAIRKINPGQRIAIHTGRRACRCPRSLRVCASF